MSFEFFFCYNRHFGITLTGITLSRRKSNICCASVFITIYFSSAVRHPTAGDFAAHPNRRHRRSPLASWIRQVQLLLHLPGWHCHLHGDLRDPRHQLHFSDRAMRLQPVDAAKRRAFGCDVARNHSELVSVGLLFRLQRKEESHRTDTIFDVFVECLLELVAELRSVVGVSVLERFFVSSS